MAFEYVVAGTGRMRPIACTRSSKLWMGFKAALLLSASLFALSALVLKWPEEDAAADRFDSHRQRLLQVAPATPGVAPAAGTVEGEENTGSIFERAKNWVVHNFVGNYSDSRHSSAYLRYRPQLPNNGPLVAWYHLLTPKHSADDTYFAVQGTNYGYFGLQQVQDQPWFEGKVVFSMWDKGKEAGDNLEDRATIIECGEMTICNRFGGEGTGVRSRINFHRWSLEHNYSFMTLAFPQGEDKARLEGYFYAEEVGGWVLLSKLEVLRGGRTWSMENLYSFTEQWSTRDFGQARWAKLGPSFIKGPQDASWTQLRFAEFDHTTGADNSNVNANVTNGGRQWGLGIGGAIQLGELRKPLLVDATDELPEPLVAWNRLVKENNLPTGCAGQTCRHRWWIALFRENFLSWTRLPRTIAIILLFGVFLCYIHYACHACGCCDSPKYEEAMLLSDDEHSDSDRRNEDHCRPRY